MQVENIDKGEETVAGKSPTNDCTTGSIVAKPPKAKRSKKTAKNVSNQELSSSQVSAVSTPTSIPPLPPALAKNNTTSASVAGATAVTAGTPVPIATCDKAPTAAAVPVRVPLAASATAVTAETSARARGATFTTPSTPVTPAPAANAGVRQQKDNSIPDSTWRERRRPSSLAVNAEGMSVDEMLKLLQAGGTRAPIVGLKNRNPNQDNDEDDTEDVNNDENEVKLDTDSDNPEVVVEGGGSESSEAVPTENGSDELDEESNENESESDEVGEDGGDMESGNESAKVVSSSSITRAGSGVSKRVQKKKSRTGFFNNLLCHGQGGGNGTVAASSTRAFTGQKQHSLNGEGDSVEGFRHEIKAKGCTKAQGKGCGKAEG